MEPQWKIQAEGVGKEATFEFPGKDGIQAQWFLGKNGSYSFFMNLFRRPESRGK